MDKVIYTEALYCQEPFSGIVKEEMIVEDVFEVPEELYQDEFWPMINFKKETKLENINPGLKHNQDTSVLPVLKHPDSEDPIFSKVALSYKKKDGVDSKHENSSQGNFFSGDVNQQPSCNHEFDSDQDCSIKMEESIEDLLQKSDNSVITGNLNLSHDSFKKPEIEYNFLQQTIFLKIGGISYDFNKLKEDLLKFVSDHPNTSTPKKFSAYYCPICFVDYKRLKRHILVSHVSNTFAANFFMSVAKVTQKLSQNTTLDRPFVMCYLCAHAIGRLDSHHQAKHKSIPYNTYKIKCIPITPKPTSSKPKFEESLESSIAETKVKLINLGVLKRSVLQMEQQFRLIIKEILRLHPNFLQNEQIMNVTDDILLEVFNIMNELQYKISTINTYFNSFKEFFGSYLMSAKKMKDFYSYSINMKNVARFLKVQSKIEKSETVLDIRETSITAEEISKFRESKVFADYITKMKTGSLKKSKILKYYVKFTTVLAFSLCFLNFQRLAAIINMTLDEFERRKYNKKKYLCTVQVHCPKACSTSGPIQIHMGTDVEHLMEKYISEIRPVVMKTDKPEVFLNLTGNKFCSSGLLMNLQRMWLDVGMKKSFTFNAIRHGVVTLVHTKYPEMRSKLATQLMYSCAKARKFYRNATRLHSSQEAVQALLTKISREQDYFSKCGCCGEEHTQDKDRTKSATHYDNSSDMFGDSVILEESTHSSTNEKSGFERKSRKCFITDKKLRNRVKDKVLPHTFNLTKVPTPTQVKSILSEELFTDILLHRYDDVTKTKEKIKSVVLAVYEMVRSIIRSKNKKRRENLMCK